MVAPYNFWGNAGNVGYAIPLVTPTPLVPTTQGYTMVWDIANQACNWAPLGWDLTTGDGTNAGNFGVAAGKVYKVNAIQVVAARRTGWAAWTGTANRATKVSDTATLADVATTLKALIDELFAHGLIGT
jgi:hypothetical protein